MSERFADSNTDSLKEHSESRSQQKESLKEKGVKLSHDQKIHRFKHSLDKSKFSLTQRFVVSETLA